jgi:hypothetical protein
MHVETIGDTPMHIKGFLMCGRAERGLRLTVTKMKVLGICIWRHSGDIWRPFREHLETFGEHLETFGEHLETFREHLETFWEHLETFREHLETFWEHLETFKEHRVRATVRHSLKKMGFVLHR